jgi:hypothetical protein
MLNFVPPPQHTHTSLHRLKSFVLTLRVKLSFAAYISKRDCKNEERQQLKQRYAHDVTKLGARVRNRKNA